MKRAVSESNLISIVSKEYFSPFECLEEDGKIDLVVRYYNKHIIWCEAKNRVTDEFVMFTQLIFTIYQHKRTKKHPRFLCVFDPEKIAFIPYSLISPLYNEMLHADFDWTVRPSDTSTKEFKLIRDTISGNRSLFRDSETIFDFQERVFYFDTDDRRLRQWIQNNITSVDFSLPEKVDESNFQGVYNEWLDEVKPYIVEDWDAVKRRYNIIDCDYFLADLACDNANKNIYTQLTILLDDDRYRHTSYDPGDFFNERTIRFKSDNPTPHIEFWKKYERPPAHKY